MLPNEIKTVLQTRYKLSSADPQKSEELLSMVETIASQVTLNSILDTLEASDIPTFISLLETDPTGEKAYEFAQQKNPQVGKIISEQLEKELTGILN